MSHYFYDAAQSAAAHRTASSCRLSYIDSAFVYGDGEAASELMALDRVARHLAGGRPLPAPPGLMEEAETEAEAETETFPLKTIRAKYNDDEDEQSVATASTAASSTAAPLSASSSMSSSFSSSSSSLASSLSSTSASAPSASSPPAPLLSMAMARPADSSSFIAAASFCHSKRHLFGPYWETQRRKDPQAHRHRQRGGPPTQDQLVRKVPASDVVALPDGNEDALSDLSDSSEQRRDRLPRRSIMPKLNPPAHGPLCSWSRSMRRSWNRSLSSSSSASPLPEVRLCAASVLPVVGNSASASTLHQVRRSCLHRCSRSQSSDARAGTLQGVAGPVSSLHAGCERKSVTKTASSVSFCNRVEVYEYSSPDRDHGYWPKLLY